MGWREELHPRDEVGKFRERHGVTGPSGAFDLMSMRAAAGSYARDIADYERNMRQQDEYVRLRDEGRLTAEQDRDWDRLVEEATRLARTRLPKAYHLGMRPATNGAWYEQGSGGRLAGFAHDERGRQIPVPAMRGAVRVGDRKGGEYTSMNRQVSHASAGGLWHIPGERSAGELVIRNDYGHPLVGDFERAAASRRHRNRSGTSARAEDRAELIDRHFNPEHPRSPRRSSADVQGSYLASPLNPVGRKRTAGVKRRRREAVAITGTWIERLEARMRAQGEAGR